MMKSTELAFSSDLSRHLRIKTLYQEIYGLTERDFFVFEGTVMDTTDSSGGTVCEVDEKVGELIAALLMLAQENYK